MSSAWCAPMWRSTGGICLWRRLARLAQGCHARETGDICLWRRLARTVKPCSWDWRHMPRRRTARLTQGSHASETARRHPSVDSGVSESKLHLRWAAIHICLYAAFIIGCCRSVLAVYNSGWSECVTRNVSGCVSPQYLGVLDEYSLTYYFNCVEMHVVRCLSVPSVRL